MSKPQPSPKEELKELFLDEFADYVNACLRHNEIVGTRNYVDFEEEAEWIADWWINKIKQ